MLSEIKNNTWSLADCNKASVKTPPQEIPLLAHLICKKTHYLLHFSSELPGSSCHKLVHFNSFDLLLPYLLHHKLKIVRYQRAKEHFSDLFPNLSWHPKSPCPSSSLTKSFVTVGCRDRQRHRPCDRALIAQGHKVQLQGHTAASQNGFWLPDIHHRLRQ